MSCCRLVFVPLLTLPWAPIGCTQHVDGASACALGSCESLVLEPQAAVESETTEVPPGDDGDEDPGPRCTEEICNGFDDDCDGATDEGVTEVCTDWSSCRTYESCQACPPKPTEVCNDVDDDCDGLIDEGVLHVCTDWSTCGRVTTCAECAAPPVESCNGRDDDCDGATDEGVMGVCTDWKTCGTFASCDACPAAPVESCNGIDDDCDGQTDEEVDAVGWPCGPGDPGFPARGTSCGGFLACEGGALRCACAADDTDCDGIADAVDPDDDNDGDRDDDDEFPLEIVTRDDTIDFSRLGHGERLADQYGDLGVRFTNGFHVAATSSVQSCYVVEPVPAKIVCGNSGVAADDICYGLEPENAQWCGSCGQEAAILGILLDAPISYASMKVRSNNACANQDGDASIFTALGANGEQLDMSQGYAHTLPLVAKTPWQQKADGEGIDLVEVRGHRITRLTLDVCDTNITDTLRLVTLADACGG